jgi:hypothetical protein
MAGEITIYTDGAASGNPVREIWKVFYFRRHRLEKIEGYRLQ